MGIYDKFADLLDTKFKIREAIQNKGVEINENDIFKNYATKIDQIATGGSIGGFDIGINTNTWQTYCGPKVDNMFQAFYNYNQYSFSAKLVEGYIGPNVINASQAFSNCRNLRYVNCASDKITNLAYTYQYCIALNSVPYIPNTVTNMYNTFLFCNNMTGDAKIPVSVDGNCNFYKTFDSCYKLESCSLLQNPITANSVNAGNTSYMFNACYNLTGNYYVPNSAYNLARMFLNCGGIDHIVIPDLPRLTTSAQWANAFLKSGNYTNKRLNVWIANSKQFTNAAAQSTGSNLLSTLTAESGSLIVDGISYPYNNYVYSTTNNVYIYGP